jgi:hypothetical protein
MELKFPQDIILMQNDWSEEELALTKYQLISMLNSSIHLSQHKSSWKVNGLISTIIWQI